MGAGQSSEPRSVSMENPSVIDLSDEVVQRLKKGISHQARENAATARSTAPQTAASSAASSSAPKKEEVRAKAIPVKPLPPPTAVPSQMYPPPAAHTLTAMDVHRLKEKELHENDALWRKRMADLEQTLNKTNSIMEKEYTAAVDNVRQRFATPSVTQQMPACQDLRKEVVACYRANPGQTLNCADVVANFRNCVNVQRVQKLDSVEDKKTPNKNASQAAKAG